MTYHTTEELIGGRSEWAVSPNNFNGLIDSHILANQRIAELEAQLSSENLELSAASREFWNSVSNLAKTRISEMRLGTDSAIRILEDIKSAINHAGRSYLLEVEGNLISLITINLRQQDRRIAELETQLAAEQKKVADLEKPAAFGWQCYQDRCENAYVEQSVVKRLEAALQVAREFISYSTCLCTGGEFPVECKRCTTLARIEEVSRG